MSGGRGDAAGGPEAVGEGGGDEEAEDGQGCVGESDRAQGPGFREGACSFSVELTADSLLVR